MSGSKVAGDPVGKYSQRDPATGRFARPAAPAAAPAEPPALQPANPVTPAPADPSQPARPSTLRRLLGSSLGDLVRGR